MRPVLIGLVAMLPFWWGCGDINNNPDVGPAGGAVDEDVAEGPSDTALQDTALQDTALQDTALQDTALQDTALQDTAGGGPDPAGACEERASQVGADSSHYTWGCQATEPCAPLHLADGDASGEPSWADGENTPLLCTLQAFKDNKAGTAVVLKRSGPTSGWSEKIFFVGDGLAVSEGSWFKDSPGEFWLHRRQIVQDGGYFDGCLTKANPAGVFECLKGWAAGCDPMPVTCR